MLFSTSNMQKSWTACYAICLLAGPKMPFDQNSKNDSVLTEHLQDQFVAWFVGVMAFFYLIEYLHENQKKKQSDYHNNLKN